MVDDDDEDDPEAQLAEALGNPAPRRDRFHCAGSKRVDEETGAKACDYRSPVPWRARPCPKCGNYFACLPIKRGESVATRTTAAAAENRKKPVYYSTGIPEFDRVIGGGVRRGKVLLLGGTRGAGKSTLLFQAGDGFARDGRKTYFASGEMSEEDNLEYVARLGIKNPDLILFSNMRGIDVDDLADDVLQTKARLLIVDSLKNCEISSSKGSLGSATMMDDCTEFLISFAKIKRIAVIIISHLSKTGDYSGSEKVQHLVDGLVRFDSLATREGERVVQDGMEGLREIYMASKNRQGSAGKSAIVELLEEPDGDRLPGIRPPSVRALRARSKLVLA